VGTPTVRADTTSAIDVFNAVTGGTTEVVTASVTNGLITLAGADAGTINTLAEWVAVARLVDTTSGAVVGFDDGVNTYVYQENAGGDLLIQLTGITGVAVTAIATTGAATTILIG
jgi:hypothetical protein